jgi:uncharacterized protein
VTLLIFAIVAYSMWEAARSSQRTSRGARYRRSGDGNVVVLPGGWGGSGGWSGGSGGGSSGGGGGFGGGGSSGSW